MKGLNSIEWKAFKKNALVRVQNSLCSVYSTRRMTVLNGKLRHCPTRTPTGDRFNVEPRAPPIYRGTKSASKETSYHEHSPGNHERPTKHIGANKCSQMLLKIVLINLKSFKVGSFRHDLERLWVASRLLRPKYLQMNLMTIYETFLIASSEHSTTTCMANPTSQWIKQVV